MSVKHIKEYYTRICQQASSMQKMLEELGQSSNDTMVSPKVLENIKKQAEPIIVNKKRLEYILYLLDMPNKDKKIKGYEERNKNLLKNMKVDAEIVENKQTLENLDNMIRKVTKK